MAVQVDTDTTERLVRDDTDFVYAWNGTTNYRYELTVMLAGFLDAADIGVTVQAYDATLAALAATAWAANALPIGTGSDTLSQVSFSPNEFPARASTGNLVAKPITDFALTILDDNNATDVRGTINAQEADSDLSAIAGLTATTDNFMQAKSSAWASRTVAQVTTDLQGTGLAADTAGFRGIPQVTFSAATTIAATHEGKDLVHPASDANARTVTIDSNANLALPVGFAFSGYNDTSQAVTIAITADTLVWIGTGGTGSRTVAQYGSWVCRKIDTTRWVISGVNIT